MVVIMDKNKHEVYVDTSEPSACDWYATLCVAFACVLSCQGCTSKETTDAPGDTSGASSLCQVDGPSGASCNPYCDDCSVGDHCTVVGEALKCAASGVRLDGDVCSETTQCAPGLGCFGLNGAEPVCHRFCALDEHCRTTDICAQRVQLEGGLQVSLCAPPASACALEGMDCPEGDACQLTNDGLRCGVPGELPAGAPCREYGANACQAGLHCVVVCTPICSLSNDVSDTVGCDARCDSFAVVDAEREVGVCLDGPPPAECVLLSSDCSLGSSCYAVGVGWICEKDGSIPVGGACVFATDCTPGHTCVDGRCRELCLVGEDGESGCATRCDGDLSVLEPASWNVGVCN